MTSKTPSRYNSFDDVKNLEELQIKRLMKNGDTAEKVWAVWSLAIKKGKSSIPELLDSCEGEPSPGVRRHLIIVLAGMQQTDLLFNLAEFDSDAFVRADALKYLIRIAPHNNSFSEFLIGKLRKDSAYVVKISILEESPEDLLKLSFNDLMVFIKASNPKLQLLSLKQLEKRINIDDQNVVFLAKLLSKKYDAHVLEKITSILSNAGYGELVLEAGMIQKDKNNFDFLMYLINGEINFPWEVLKKFTNQPYSHNIHRIVEFIQSPAHPETFSWLTERYAKMLDLESWEDDFNEIQRLFLKILGEIDKPDRTNNILTANLQIIHQQMESELYDLQHDETNEWSDFYGYSEEEHEENVSYVKANIDILENWLK